jgi:hypothetical protein
VRVYFIGLLIAIVLLIIAVALPSKRDTSVAAWWSRVRYQFDFFARVALVLAVLGAVAWFLLIPMLRVIRGP